MPNWLDLYTIVILIIFLIEILVARHIYKSTRKRNHSSQQRVLLVLAPSPLHARLEQPTRKERSHQLVSPTLHEYMLPSPSPKPNEIPDARGAMITCILGVFLTSFIIINWLLRPFTYAWTLPFLTILTPLPFLALPVIFRPKTSATFGFLMGGLGLSLILFLLL